MALRRILPVAGRYWQPPKNAKLEASGQESRKPTRCGLSQLVRTCSQNLVSTGSMPSSWLMTRLLMSGVQKTAGSDGGSIVKLSHSELLQRCARLECMVEGNNAGVNS